jgi:hypothetical protein
MSWLGSAPVVVLCCLLLVVPALPITHLLGLRGLAAVTLAPVVVVTVADLTAIVASRIGVPWSPLLLLVVFAGLAAVLAGVTLTWRRVLRPVPGDRLTVIAAAAGGVLVAMLLGAVTVARAISGPEELIQSSDSPFHYNAVAHILDSHDASSFAIDSLGVPGHASGFYPAAWHGLASLLVMITGVSVPAAANILAATIALLVWPLGCVLLVRQIVGPSRLAVGLAGLLSVGFGAFPWELMGWGVLWPNLLGLSLVPAALAVVLSACGMARDDVVGRGRAWLLLPVLVVGIAFAHPNAVVTLIALALPPAAIVLGRAARSRYRAGDRPRAVLLAAPLVLAVPAYWVGMTVVFGSSSGPMAADSPSFESPSHAIGEVLTGATNGRGAGWLFAALVLVGAGATFVRRNHRWLVASHLVGGALYVLAAGVPGDLRRLVTGFWYTDSHRMAAIVPITGVPLAVIGVIALVGAARVRVAALGGWPRGVLPERRSLLVALAVVALVVLVTGGLNSGDNRTRVLAAYPKVDPLVDAQEKALFVRIARDVEPGAVIAAVPWNGSAAVMALSRRQLLFPQINTGHVTPDEMYLANRLVKAASDPEVCRIADRLNVRYLLTNDIPRGTVWDGLTYPHGAPGFEFVDRGGTFELYRMTACGGGGTVGPGA